MNSDYLIEKLVGGILQPDPEKREKWMITNSKPIIQITGLWLKQLAADEVQDDQLHLVISCILNVTAAANHKDTSRSDHDALLSPLREDPKFILQSLSYIVHDHPLVDMYIGILINMTRDKEDLKALLSRMKGSSGGSGGAVSGGSDGLLRQLVIKLPETPAILGILINMTQNGDARSILVKHNLIENAFQLYDKSDNVEEKFKILQLIRNISFDESLHETLLTNQAVGLLARVLLPLMSPEEYDEDETEKFPLDCQYLPPEKVREPSWDMRRVLLDILLLFCSKKYGRDCLRDRGVYYVLRELHKWEENNERELYVEKVIDILIKEEYEFQGVDSLIKHEVPSDLTERFHKDDEELAKI